MKARSKFAYLLSAGGSLLSKESLTRRLRLPSKKPAPIPISEDEAETQAVKPSANLQSNRFGVRLMMERIGREGIEHRKSKQV